MTEQELFSDEVNENLVQLIEKPTNIISDLNQNQEDDVKQGKIILIDPDECTSHSISLEEALTIPRQTEEYLYRVLYCCNLSTKLYRQLRKGFNLHPVLNLANSLFEIHVKDNFLTFTDYFVINMTDVGKNDDFERLSSMRIIVFQSLLLILSNSRLANIEQVFSEELQRSRISYDLQNDSTDIKRIYKRAGSTLSLYASRVEASAEEPISAIEKSLYKIFEATMSRLEILVLRLIRDAKHIFDHSSNLSMNERVDFILRMNITDYQLTLLASVIEPKIRLFKKMSVQNVPSIRMKYFLKAMASRARMTSRQIMKSQQHITNAQNIYQATVEDTLTKITLKLNDIMMFFSAIATIFLPLNLVGALWGMNVAVPGQEEESMYPFFIICGVCASVLVFAYSYFRNKGWIQQCFKIMKCRMQMG